MVAFADATVGRFCELTYKSVFLSPKWSFGSVLCVKNRCLEILVCIVLCFCPHLMKS